MRQRATSLGSHFAAMTWISSGGSEDHDPRSSAWTTGTIEKDFFDFVFESGRCQKVQTKYIHTKYNEKPESRHRTICLLTNTGNAV
jgi:hypothetical protein